MATGGTVDMTTRGWGAGGYSRSCQGDGYIRGVGR